MRVEIAYAKPEEQVILSVEIGEKTTAEEAIRASGILSRFPEINLAAGQIGIFGKPCGKSVRLRSGDRVEIYRPLLTDPKTARRERASRA